MEAGKEKDVRIFRSHEEADKADREYYRSLTPEERIKIVLELRNLDPRINDGFARVCRVIRRKADSNSYFD